MSSPDDVTETRKVVRPIHKLLADLTANNLLDFLHEVRLQWTMSRSTKGHYTVTLYQADGRKWIVGGSVDSYRFALADAVSKFLLAEERDYHTVSKLAGRTLNRTWTEDILYQESEPN